jgi:hypothetical protein
MRLALLTLMPVLAAAASWLCLPRSSLYLVTCRSVMRLAGTVAASFLRQTTVEPDRRTHPGGVRQPVTIVVVDRRIDSSVLLPELTRCLTKLATRRIVRREQSECDEANQHDNTQGVGRGTASTVWRRSGRRQGEDPGRVRGPDGLPPQARHPGVARRGHLEGSAGAQSSVRRGGAGSADGAVGSRRSGFAASG